MPSDDDFRTRQRRTGWWLLVARLSAGRTQGDAAVACGLAAASSYGDFERGVTAPSLRQLVQLATFFEVPLSLLTDPPETDEERLEALTDRASARTDPPGEEVVRRRRAG